MFGNAMLTMPIHLLQLLMPMSNKNYNIKQICMCICADINDSDIFNVDTVHGLIKQAQVAISISIYQ